MSDRRTEGRVEWRGRDCLEPQHQHSRCPYRVRRHTGFDPVTGKRQYVYATGRGNAKVAEKALRDLLGKRDNGITVQPTRTTTAEWLDTWLEGRIADGKVGLRAAENYRIIVTRRLKPAVGTLRLTDLRTDHVIAFKTSLIDEGLAPATIGKVLGLLRQSLEAAVKAGLILRNPTQGVERPSVSSTATERRALSEEELSRLLSAASGTQYEVAIRFALATGVRQSELLGARWSDIDLEGGSFTIQQTIQHVAGQFHALAPKTSNSRRLIELSPITLALLRRHRTAQNEERLRLGSIWQDRGLVFPASDGSPQYRRIFYRDYVAIVRTAGLDHPETINWHSLRHTAASLWIKAGIDVFVVSRRLGHANPGFTMKVYTHLLPGQQRAAAAALDHLLAVP
ncbi:MAG: site-specific integrase [Chloroflexota bacterium]